eukprot:TRINITY_DN11641_c0_g1_i1.p1 TRINITY_DN11641_c0_g1~~TRINITY_DN11641_c0_g1_i1.p1  ORF type:complete len:1253 (+),score=374.20 TRINITY_DN11641_c0_g1_i1:95-3760(+)
MEDEAREEEEEEGEETASSSSSAGDECRLDPYDHKPYTKEEFKCAYPDDWRSRWASATRQGEGSEDSASGRIAAEAHAPLAPSGGAAQREGDEGELRRDGGEWYTREQFWEYYGDDGDPDAWLQKWEEAERAEAERRRDSDGGWYTKEQFREFYETADDAGTWLERWKAAPRRGGVPEDVGDAPQAGPPTPSPPLREAAAAAAGPDQLQWKDEGRTIEWVAGGRTTVQAALQRNSSGELRVFVRRKKGGRDIGAAPVEGQLLLCAAAHGACDLRDSRGWVAQLPDRGSPDLGPVLAGLAEFAAQACLPHDIPPQFELPERFVLRVDSARGLARSGLEPSVSIRVRDGSPHLARTPRGEEHWRSYPVLVEAPTNDPRRACDRSVRVELTVSDRGSGGYEGDDGFLGHAVLVLSPCSLRPLRVGSGASAAKELALAPRPDRPGDHMLAAGCGDRLGSLRVIVSAAEEDHYTGRAERGSAALAPAAPQMARGDPHFRAVTGSLLYALRGGCPRTPGLIAALAAAPAAQLAAERCLAGRAKPPLPVGPSEGAHWAPFALRAFSEADFASPLWTALLPDERPVVHLHGQAAAPAAATTVIAIERGPQEEAGIQTDLRIEDIWALEDKVALLTGHDPSVDDSASYAYMDDAQTVDAGGGAKRVLFAVGGSDRPDEDDQSMARSGSLGSRSMCSAVSMGTLASRMSQRFRGTGGGQRQVMVCPSAKCKAVNVAPPPGRGSRAARELNYCIECGCFMRTEQPDGLHEELDRLRHTVDRQEQEIKQIEEYVRTHQREAARARCAVVGSEAAWRAAAERQLVRCQRAGAAARLTAAAERRKEQSVASPSKSKGAMLGTLALDMSPRARVERRREVLDMYRRQRDGENRAVSNYDAQRSLFRSRIKTELDQRLLLFRAAAAGDTAPFLLLAQRDPGMSIVRMCYDEGHRTPLHLAAAAGHVGVLRACLEPPQQLLERARMARLAHGCAAEVKQRGILTSPRYEEQARAERELAQWRLPLHEAERLFLTPTTKGITLLHCAVLSGRLGVVEWMLGCIRAIAKRAKHPRTRGGHTQLLEGALFAGRKPLEGDTPEGSLRCGSPRSRRRQSAKKDPEGLGEAAPEKEKELLTMCAADCAAWHSYSHIAAYLKKEWFRVFRREIATVYLAAAMVGAVAVVAPGRKLRSPRQQPRDAFSPYGAVPAPPPEPPRGGKQRPQLALPGGGAPSSPTAPRC